MAHSDTLTHSTSMTTADELKRQIMARRKSGPIPDLSYLAENGCKKCKTCKKTKSVGDFCKSSRSLDLLNRDCRNCSNERLKKYKKPGYNSENCKRYNAKNKEKRAAHRKVQHALNKGIIARQPCFVCRNAKSEAHHEDYTRPLDVIWFCRQHHAAHHEQKRNENQTHSTDSVSHF
jgi:hypothetical protein